MSAKKDSFNTSNAHPHFSAIRPTASKSSGRLHVQNPGTLSPRVPPEPAVLPIDFDSHNSDNDSEAIEHSANDEICSESPNPRSLARSCLYVYEISRSPEIPPQESPSSLALVDSMSSTSVESLPTWPEDGPLIDIQRQYLARAMLMARSLSQAQLRKRSRALSDQLRSISASDDAAANYQAAAASTKGCCRPKKNKRKEKRARLTIVPPPLAAPTDLDKSLSPSLHATVDTSTVESTECLPVVTLPHVGNFNPYTDRSIPLLRGSISRAMVIKVTHLLQLTYALFPLLIAFLRNRDLVF